MKKVSLAAFVLCLPMFVLAQDAAPPPHAITRIYRRSAPEVVSGTILYAGGPVMSGPTNVYVVFYGTWPAASRNIVNAFLKNIGGSHYYKINTAFDDSTGKHIQNIVNYNALTNSYNDAYSLGKALTDAKLQTVLSNAIAAGHLPKDNANGIYFVLTAKDVSVSAMGGTFCGTFCGYHSPSNSIVAGETIRYAFVGNPARCAMACSGNVAVFGDATTPNSDIGGDGIVSVMFHELSETVSDPFVGFANGAWGADVTPESADLCNFYYGINIKVAANGSHYNDTINGKNYLIQQLARVSPPTPAKTGNYKGICQGYMQ